MDTLASTTVYSTSTGEANPFIALTTELENELGIHRGEISPEDEYIPYDMADYIEFCFVCSRATDHRGEHDDLVEQGLAVYSRNTAEVFRNY